MRIRCVSRACSGNRSMERNCDPFWLRSMVLALALFQVAPATLSPSGINYEVVALMAIKVELNDPHNVLENWDVNSVDPCSWRMVTCSSDGYVSVLGLPSQSLSGMLSPGIGNLTNLQSVLLQNNAISGPIPADVGRLEKLQTLDLSNNQFSGNIPSSLGDLKNLNYLRLNNNSLSGPLPDSMSNIKGLTLLDLSYNNLSGSIPKIAARTFNIVGNPSICGQNSVNNCSSVSLNPLSFPPDDLRAQSQPGVMKSRSVAIAFGASVGSIVLVVIFVGLLLWHRRHNQQIFFDVNDQYDPEVRLGHLKRYSFKELRVATNHFNSKNILGKGGYGIVYKGCLRDGTIIAVKRLKDYNAVGGEVQFQTEVEMISLAVHRNLLRLWGFCTTENERLLVYPYMPNGSVASQLREHVHGRPALDWPRRKKIALGTARGLLYLHEQCDPKIIHRDVKAANILLDEEFEAIVGDFGLAKLLDHQESHVTTAVRGTVGHIAPEYLSTGQSSEKTDVFAQIVALDKAAIMRRSGLPARDLRLLDPVFVYPSTILGREKAIVVSLEQIRCIIMADDVLLMNSLDSCVFRYESELCKRVQMTQNQNDDLPFEFKALELALELSSTSLDAQVTELEIEVYPLLDELVSSISTTNLEHVRRLKSHLLALTHRVQKVRDEIEHLMDDDDDMAEMYLTEKKESMEACLSTDRDNTSVSSINMVSKSAPVSPTGSSNDRPEKVWGSAIMSLGKHESSRGSYNGGRHVEELEMLLEAYFVVVDNTLNKLLSLKEYIDDTEDFINIKLSNVQNQLIQLELLLTAATFVVTIFAVVTGVFGMNFVDSVFDQPSNFNLVLVVSSVLCTVIYSLFLLYFKHKRLLPS